MKNGKAPGLDMITTEFFKNLPRSWLSYLETFFNKILDSEKLAKEWVRTVLFMLHKKGDQSDPANYRGLAMLNVVFKIFSSIIKVRLDR